MIKQWDENAQKWVEWVDPMKISIEPSDDAVGEPLQLGHFEVRRCATGWIVNTRPMSETRNQWIEPWAAFHAFTTWEDMLKWIVVQPRPADVSPPKPEPDDIPF